MDCFQIVHKCDHVTVIQTATATFVWRAPDWDDLPPFERDYLDELWERVVSKYLI